MSKTGSFFWLNILDKSNILSQQQKNKNKKFVSPSYIRNS